ncbi:MAG TPA: aldolase/citrate lyase family protein [Anaerolineae bacterium]|nr:aldolase/citrate lyase family protein [Anaerolineae bacterium]HQK14978.1 aldolase/citrate lyase family protein [Anaerolineae bacterium]
MASIGINKIKTNPIVDKLRSGQPSVGSWLSLCSPVAAEMMAQIGWDWLVVDVEHSPVGFETMVNCFRAVQLGGAVPMARVPWNDTIWIQRTLDAGALGLVVPMVNTAEDARAVVSNMRYATKGQRSFAGSRVAAYIEGDYRTWTDDNLAVMVMIETAQAVENAEAILATEGVTGCFIGPNDLALSLGVSPSETGPGTVHEAAIQAVLAAAKKTGKAAGKHCFNVAELNLRIRQGFQFLALASDLRFMTKAAREEFDAIDFTGAAAVSAAETN